MASGSKLFDNDDESQGVLGGTNDALGGSNATRKSRVSYYYDEDFSVFQVSEGHPMKPLRIKMTDTLINSYGLQRSMDRIEVD